MLADYHSLCSWLRCRVTTRFGCLRQLVIQIKETTTFFANSTAIIVDMLVLTICATHGFVVPLNKTWTVSINLLFYAAPSLYLFDRFCSKSCRAYSDKIVIILPSHQFHLLITVNVSPNSCTNIPSFAAFLHLFDRNKLALLSFAWSFLPNRFLHPNRAPVQFSFG